MISLTKMKVMMQDEKNVIVQSGHLPFSSFRRFSNVNLGYDFTHTDISAYSGYITYNINF